jgi:Protein of unknown function (DUF3618)
VAQDPSEIREAIEETRDEIEETIQALGEKVDIKARAGEKLAGGREAVKDAAAGATAKASDVAQGVSDSVANATTSAASSASGWARSTGEQLSKPGRGRKTALICISSMAVVLALLAARRVRHRRRKQ